MNTNTSGRFVWHELVTPDPRAALGFYSELFGWSTAEVDMGPAGKYTLLKAGGVDVGGAVAPPPGSNVSPSWLAYWSVLDVDAAAKKATSLGGKVMAPPMDIPNVGRFAVLLDAQCPPPRRSGFDPTARARTDLACSGPSAARMRRSSETIEVCSQILESGETWT